MPVKFGGDDTASNVVASCRECNLAKGAGIIVPPLLDEIIAEICTRNAKQGINGDTVLVLNAFRPDLYIDGNSQWYNSFMEDWLGKHGVA